MRVTDLVPKVVSFIGHRGVDGSFVADGTAFLVLMQAHQFGLSYMVSAKHVIDQAAGRDSPPRDVLIRINTKAGGVEYITTKPDRWHTHPDHTCDEGKQNYIDVVVFAMANMREWSSINMEALDYTYLVEEDVCTDEVIKKYAIGIGDEVVIPGLFHSHLGTQRNVPIVRTGNIAAMRDEPVPTSYGSMNAYLVEMRSIDGISGSPVLMHMEMRPAVLLPESDVAIAVEKSKKVHYLFGLVHGHYTITTQDEWVYKTNSLVGDINAGIAVVVPASKIMETIRQPTVFGEEQEMARKYREAMGAPK
jgi:hypothetical protein